jgi:hypothetical protein
MTSYKQLIDRLETFSDNHLQVKKFGSDFLEQLPNFATTDEKYPIIFVVPVSSGYGDIVNNINIDIYCFDIIQKGRENLNTIISDTHQILNDYYLELNTGDDWSVDVLSSSVTPLNNELLDYCAGWVLSLSLEVETYCETDIPVV